MRARPHHAMTQIREETKKNQPKQPSPVLCAQVEEGRARERERCSVFSLSLALCSGGLYAKNIGAASMTYGARTLPDHGLLRRVLWCAARRRTGNTQGRIHTERCDSYQYAGRCYRVLFFFLQSSLFLCTRSHTQRLFEHRRKQTVARLVRPYRAVVAQSAYA